MFKECSPELPQIRGTANVEAILNIFARNEDPVFAFATAVELLG
jgi:hypothetical protein